MPALRLHFVNSPAGLALCGHILRVVVLACAVVSCRCPTPRETRQAGLPRGVYLQIQKQTTNQFANSVLCKPSECFNLGESFQLAPLLMQETHQPVSAAPGILVNEMAFDNLSHLGPGSLGQAPSPTIYQELAQTRLQGAFYSQLTYRWYYPAAQRGGSRTVVMRGIRMTLNQARQPVIWEALDDGDDDDPDVLYVARSLEDKAAAEFGAPARGRSYAIERPSSQAPQTIVARVIEDGPLPMGPVVYLEEQTRNIRVILCRCMPAQSKAVASETLSYALLPQELANIAGRTDGKRSREKPSLEHRLRLPAL